MLAALLLAGCGNGDRGATVAGDHDQLPRLGLMTTLPIFWPQQGAIAALAEGAEDRRHWALETLAKDYRVEPVDLLSAGELARIDWLVLAQPRPLTPAENVALDHWVREGGYALVLADPRLVGDYAFPLGDPRRPLDTALLSPILARWGLELLDEGKGPAPQIVTLGDAGLAVAGAGRFRLRPSAVARCRLALAGLAAQCAVGKGRVALLADATLMEDREGGPGSPAALGALLGMVRDASRENAGEHGP